MPPAIDNNKKQTDCAENKKNCPNTTTTTTNNGVIKVSMVGEIAMSNFHNHQCKQSACFYIVCMHNGLKLFLKELSWFFFLYPYPYGIIQHIPNGCFDAYEVKVNKDIFEYQEKVKLISQFRRFFKFFNGSLEFALFPQKNCKITLKCLHPLGI